MDCRNWSIITDEGDLFSKRKKGFHSLRRLGTIQIVLGVLTVILGAVCMYLVTGDASHFPFVVAAPLWIGIIVMCAGIMGIYTTRYPPENKALSSKIKANIIVYNGMCLVSCLMGLLLLGFSIVGLVYCSSNKSNLKEKCQPHVEGNIITSSFAVIFSVLIIFYSTLGGMVLYIYWRAFSFRSIFEAGVETGIQIMHERLSNSSISPDVWATSTVNSDVMRKSFASNGTVGSDRQTNSPHR